MTGSNPASYTLGQEIEEEYFPSDQLPENRQGIFCPDLDEEHFLLVDSVEDYLGAMSLHRTHIDEFMLSAFARMWNVRVAVIRPQGKGLTKEHSQCEPPDEPVPAERTVFLYRSGHHFEWAHANASPCQDPRCHSHNRRVSASHTPTRVPSTQVQAQPEKPRQEQPANAANPPGSRPSRGIEHDLPALIRQLIEEYPGLDPERAEAALKLTKQNGRYNLYAAAAVLPGREGAPIVLESPSLSRSSEDQSEQDAASSVYFTDGTCTTHTEGESGCEGDKQRKRRNDTSDDDDDMAADTQAARHAASNLMQAQKTQREDGAASERASNTCGHHHRVRETCSFHSAPRPSKEPGHDHVQRCRELHQISLQQEAEKAALERRRAVRMAAQIISIAAKVS